MEILERISKDPLDGDGQSVEVWGSEICQRKRIHKLVVLSEPNSINQPQAGFEIIFGSGMEELARGIAKAISEGMLGLGRVTVDQIVKEHITSAPVRKSCMTTLFEGTKQ